MYHALSVLTGAIIAVMIVVNGRLSGYYGLYTSAVIIHIVGLVFAALWLIKSKADPKPDKGVPLYCYLGGVVGAATTVFNNMAFGHISVSAILALLLLGQSVTSIIIDQTGWLGMPKSAFNRKKLAGLAFILAGIVIMLLPQSILS